MITLQQNLKFCMKKSHKSTADSLPGRFIDDIKTHVESFEIRRGQKKEKTSKVEGEIRCIKF
jgi:hypothetical protein